MLGLLDKLKSGLTKHSNKTLTKVVAVIIIPETLILFVIDWYRKRKNDS